jgi:hypothetical protein
LISRKRDAGAPGRRDEQRMPEQKMEEEYAWGVMRGQFS